MVNFWKWAPNEEISNQQKNISLQPSGVLFVPDSSSSKIGIIKATFVSEMNPAHVIVTRGSLIQPIFEKLRYLNEENKILKQIQTSEQQLPSFINSISSKEKKTTTTKQSRCFDSVC